jgi:prepilin-type N-terminal cleavage/methylation domain-containing protein
VRDDEGFTLIELLIAIVILAVIIVPLSNGLIAFFRNTDNTTGTLSESHDLQIAAAYFAQDVQSLGVRDWTASPFALKQSVEIGVAGGAGTYPCGTHPAADLVARLVWDDPTSASSAPVSIRASYVVQTVGGELQLHRLLCGNGTAAVTSDVILVHNLDTAGPALCPATTAQCTAPTVPQQMNLTITIKNRATSSALVHTLTGQRRQS